MKNNGQGAMNEKIAQQLPTISLNCCHVPSERGELGISTSMSNLKRKWFNKSLKLFFNILLEDRIVIYLTFFESDELEKPPKHSTCCENK